VKVLVEEIELLNKQATSRLARPRPHSRHLTQEHTNTVFQDQDYVSSQQIGDALFTRQPQISLVIRTADCVPVFLASPNSHGIAHAGWRGTKNGIVQNLVACFDDPSQIRAHIGPAISARHFEIGPDVYDDWSKREPQRFKPHLYPSPNGGDRRMLDLRGYIRDLLIDLGVPAEHISISPLCTFEDPDLPSYRRDKTEQRIWHTIGPAESEGR
jgi:YfiH family protein